MGMTYVSVQGLWFPAQESKEYATVCAPELKVQVLNVGWEILAREVVVDLNKRMHCCWGVGICHTLGQEKELLGCPEECKEWCDKVQEHKVDGGEEFIKTNLAVPGEEDQVHGLEDTNVDIVGSGRQEDTSCWMDVKYRYCSFSTKSSVIFLHDTLHAANSLHPDQQCVTLFGRLVEMYADQIQYPSTARYWLLANELCFRGSGNRRPHKSVCSPLPFPSHAAGLAQLCPSSTCVRYWFCQAVCLSPWLSVQCLSFENTAATAL